MPLYQLVCERCGEPTRRLLDRPPADWGGCPRIAAGFVLGVPHASTITCGGPLVRAGVGPSSQAVERLDNGAMPRALERLADAERLHAARAREADELAGTANRTVGS